MTFSPGRPGDPDLRRHPHSSGQFEDYESTADPDVCLHLPADECDHRTFRCADCCQHRA